MELDTEVLIVGAGPTGLMLANWLLKLGIDAVVVDRKDGPTTESRALVVQARSMEIYDQLGIVDDVLARSAEARWLAPGFEGRAFGRIPLGALGAGLTQYPRIYVLEQSQNEHLLYENLQRLGGDVRWRHELTALDGTTARVAGAADGDLTVRARFVVGADGSSSAVRRLRGIAFEGVTNDQTFHVTDATEVSGLVPDAVNVRPAEDGFLLAFPMGGPGDFRLIGVVRDADEDDQLTEDDTRQQIARVFGVEYGPSRWFSTYRVHHRVAAAFRDGPVFLAGDAAHVHSPVGAQGMNTGLQDAHNLAFALADVLAGRAPEDELDRYEAERRPVARRLVSTTDRLFGAVTSTWAPARLARRVVPPLLAPLAVRTVPRIGGASRLFAYVAQLRIHYWTRGRERGRRGRVVGRRLPWSGGNFAALSSLRWQAHAYGSVPVDLPEQLRGELGLDLAAFPVADRATGLREGLVYLVRPDGFVVAAATPAVAIPAFRRALPPGFPHASDPSVRPTPVTARRADSRPV